MFTKYFWLMIFQVMVLGSGYKKYLKKIEIKKDVIIRAASFEDGIQIGGEITEEAKMHIAFGKKVALTEKASPKYNTGGLDALTNGVGGQNSRYGDKEWLGFEGTDLNATIDLGSKTKFNSFSTRFYFLYRIHSCG